jgi:lysophospholipase-2
MQDPYSSSIPVFWGHGRDDSTVPPTWALASRKALQELGYNQIEFKQYEGLIHSVNQEELKDMHTWLSTHLAPV